ncbi:MAG: tRNA (adenosine(37)-N6)-threonylcarbamoyltransferase complex dimerization subunit type 1 TsaB [Lachnospiraceae bacterium]|nr:tRNA (adenosine(37)-N6)-threonylcarbamoyltransferase complex dimerization subunit type 1 TsaB [Lachnospiraceae bacterium]
MKIVAIDSSSMVASVAVWEDDIILAEYTINHKKTHSQTLLPMLDEIKKMIELDMDTVDGIAVTGGPGSFTGLRIGSATAKGVGLALNIPIINVPTMDAMAYNLYGIDGLICPIMDARRTQVFTGIYRFENKKMITVKEQAPMDLLELIDELNNMGEKVTFTGDGIASYGELIKENMNVEYEFPPAHLNRQRAAALATLAAEYMKNNMQERIETAGEHSPEYLRLSQAERERNNAMKGE